MPTIKNVADMAGVSLTTASFVLNGRAEEFKISPKCSQKVLRAARKLKYQKNYLARALSTGKSMTVGLIMNSSLDNRMWGPIAQGVEEGAIKYKKDLLLISKQWDGRNAFTRGLEYLQNKRLDVLIVTGGIPTEKIPGNMRRKPLPIVSINGPETERFPTITLDPFPGIRDAVRHLSGFGHREILYISKGSEEKRFVKDRLAAFMQSVQGEGVKGDMITIEAEQAYFNDLSLHIRHNIRELETKFRPGSATAVICHNDAVGLGLYQVLADHRMKIPKDISVIGFDDVHASSALPPMTTISHMFRQMGVRAVEVAEELLTNSKGLRGRRIEVPSELVVRESTGPAPK